MPRWLLAAVILASGSCTPTDDASEPVVSYVVDFGREGGGEIELDAPNNRICLTLGVRDPKAAHLHWRRAVGPDDLLETFFEPPARPRTHACADQVDAHVFQALADDDGNAYVDLHYDPHDDELVGRLELPR